MKKYRLKSWVLPSIYILSIVGIILSVTLVGNYVGENMDQYEDINSFVSGDVVDNFTKVINVNQPSNVTVKYPYLLENVTVAKNFYDKNASDEEKVNSLIYYKNTYMENTGILYTSSEQFDVVSVLDGTVTSITEDEFLGKVVEIAHTTELITIYQCLGEVEVKVGDNVKQNDVIGKSGKSNLDKGYENALLFEVNYKGSILNPNEFYTMKISDLMQ